MIGVVIGTGWLSYTAGRLLHRYGRGPAALLASRRLTTDPWAGSRTFAALLAAVIVGAGAAGMRAMMLARAEVDRRTGSGNGHGGFYLRTMDLSTSRRRGDGDRRRRTDRRAGRGHRRPATGVRGARRHRGAAGHARPVDRLAGARPGGAGGRVALTVGLLLSRGLSGGPVRGGGGMVEICDAAERLCADPLTRAQHIRIEQVPEVTASPAYRWSSWPGSAPAPWPRCW